MSIVLKNQVEASEKSVRELESLVARDRATPGRDVEALMAQVVDIHHELNHYVERWQEDVAARKVEYDPAAAQSLFDLYARLEQTALKTAQLGRTMESWGYRLAGKDKFLTTWRELKGITSFSPDRVAESFAQISRGQTKSLGEFADELSRGSGL